MSSKHRKKIAALFAPKRVNADNRYGIHILDSTKQEIREGSPADSWRRIIPTGFPGWQHSNSPVIEKCLILIERGLRGIPLTDLPVELLQGLEPELAAAVESAGLTEGEADVLALAGNGWKQREIAGWLEIDQATVSRRLRRGRGKVTTRLPQTVAVRLKLVNTSA